MDSSSSSSKPPPVKRSKEDTKEPEKKKIRKRSVKASPAVKMSHSNTSNINNDCIVQCNHVILFRYCIGRHLYARFVGHIIKVWFMRTVHIHILHLTAHGQISMKISTRVVILSK